MNGAGNGEHEHVENGENVVCDFFLCSGILADSKQEELMRREWNVHIPHSIQFNHISINVGMKFCHHRGQFPSSSSSQTSLNLISN